MVGRIVLFALTTCEYDRFCADVTFIVDLKRAENDQ